MRQLDDGTKSSRRENGNVLFILIHGEVDVETSVRGKSVHLARLRENDFFGEIGFLTGKPRTATIRSIGAVEALELDRDALTSSSTVTRSSPSVFGPFTSPRRAYGGSRPENAQDLANGASFGASSARPGIRR